MTAASRLERAGCWRRRRRSAWCSSAVPIADRDPDVLLLGQGARPSRRPASRCAGTRPSSAIRAGWRRCGHSTCVALISSPPRWCWAASRPTACVRGSFRGRDWAEGNFMAPLIVPTIIVADRALSRLRQDRAAGLAGRPGPGAHGPERAAGHDGDGGGDPRASTRGSSRWPGALAPRGATPCSAR